MKGRQSRSVWKSAAVITILLLVCPVGFVAAILFVGISFLLAGPQTAPISAAQQVAHATSAHGTGNAAPPRPRPAGTIIWTLPTPDYSLDANAPTAIFDPTLPTLEPTVEVDSTAPTLAPLNIVTPVSDTRTYADPSLGFSFEYPSNWSIEEDPSPPKSRGTGSRSVTIRNYDNVIQKRPITSEQLRIDIIIGSLDRFSGLEEWAALYFDPKNDDPVASFPTTPIENITVAGIPALAWKRGGYMIPLGATSVGFLKEKRVYIIGAYPATSTHINIFDQVIASFRFQ